MTRLVDLDALTADDLRHLAWLRAQVELRRLAAIPPNPTAYPSGGRRCRPRRLARLVTEMVLDGYPEPVVAKAVVEMAVERGTPQWAAERAVAWGIAESRDRGE